MKLGMSHQPYEANWDLQIKIGTNGHGWKRNLPGKGNKE